MTTFETDSHFLLEVVYFFGIHDSLSPGSPSTPDSFSASSTRVIFSPCCVNAWLRPGFYLQSLIFLTFPLVSLPIILRVFIFPPSAGKSLMSLTTSSPLNSRLYIPEGILNSAWPVLKIFYVHILSLACTILDFSHVPNPASLKSHQLFFLNISHIGCLSSLS